VARFYKPIDHAVLLEQCKRMGVSQVSQSIVSQYLPRPENKKTRKQENKKTRKQENKSRHDCGWLLVSASGSAHANAFGSGHGSGWSVRRYRVHT